MVFSSKGFRLLRHLRVPKSGSLEFDSLTDAVAFRLFFKWFRRIVFVNGGSFEGLCHFYCPAKGDWGRRHRWLSFFGYPFQASDPPIQKSETRYQFPFVVFRDSRFQMLGMLVV